MTDEVGLLFAQDADAISQYKDLLKERMDPDFGLLGKLRAREALSGEEIDEIRVERPYRRRNLKIIEYILLKNKFRVLIDALKDANQTHLANYLISNGEYKAEFVGDWPLGEKEVATLDANEESLVDLLDTTDLLCRMFSTGVINRRQMEFISSKPTSYEKNEELLGVLRRSSLSNYWQTIKCLRSSNQSHIADIFDKGGVLVQTDVTLDTEGADVNATEEVIVKGITNLLSDRSLPERNRILELVQLRLIGTKVGHSVALYFHCLELTDVDRLQEICDSGHMKNIAETVFNRLLQAAGNSRVKIKLIVCRSSFERSRHFCQVFEVAERRQQGSEVIPHETTMNELPLELMDLILQKSYLCFVTIENRFKRCSIKENLFSKMASVDYCWFQRLRKRRFKTRIWRHLTAFYKDADKCAIYRINHRYFAETIKPTLTLIGLLRSADCLTDSQSRLLCRVIHVHGKGKTMRNNLDINADLLHFVRFFSAEAKYSDFIGCLNQSKHNIVTKFTQGGGGAAIKVKVLSVKWVKQDHLVQKFSQETKDVQDRDKPWPAEMHKLTCQLIDNGIEIIGAYPDRQGVAWIWSRSQIAFQNLRSLDDQHDLVKLLTYQDKIPQTATGTMRAATQLRNIDIDDDQFKKTLVLFPIFANFTASLEVEDEEFVVGVAKLRKEFYVLCGSVSSQSLIRVFQITAPFRLEEKIELKTVKFPEDIVSSENSNCLYIIDTWKQCIWKLTRASEYTYTVTNWLSTGIDWSYILSMSRDGDLLIVRGCGPLSRLEIYGTDANLRLSIRLPPEIEFPQHAVETSTGNFVIMHERLDEVEGCSRSRLEWGIWEVSRNGKMVVRSFIPQVTGQQLDSPRYLLIDSGDRVFVADAANGRVILLDSDLRWKGILIGDLRYLPVRITYDEAKKQLVVTGECRGFSPKIYNFKGNY